MVLSKSILEADSACVISRRVPVSANRFLLPSVYVCDASLCCAARSMVMVLKSNCANLAGLFAALSLLSLLLVIMLVDDLHRTFTVWSKGSRSLWRDLSLAEDRNVLYWQRCCYRIMFFNSNCGFLKLLMEPCDLPVSCATTRIILIWITVSCCCEITDFVTCTFLLCHNKKSFEFLPIGRFNINCKMRK